MYKVGNIKIDKALLLAPMEDVTGVGFRKLCKEFGADVLFTEFVNSDGLIRKNKRTHKKMHFLEQERPVGIQIYGGNLEPMIEAAKIAEKENPDLVDINAGCWVKKVAGRGAGAGLLKDPEYFELMVRSITNVVSLPVTVKTRLGWDKNSINILDVARRIEDAGAASLTIHCRTRVDGHSTLPEWEWVPRIKELVDFPVVLNGGIWTPEDVKTAFEQTGADGIMIARGAIGNPWIFEQSKQLLSTGSYQKEIDIDARVKIILRHLKYEIEYKDNERAAVVPFRKFYSGYLKGLYSSSAVRQEIMKHESYLPIEDILFNYAEQLKTYGKDQLISAEM